MIDQRNVAVQSLRKDELAHSVDSTEHREVGLVHKEPARAVPMWLCGAAVDDDLLPGTERQRGRGGEERGDYMVTKTAQQVFRVPEEGNGVEFHLAGSAFGQRIEPGQD